MMGFPNFAPHRRPAPASLTATLILGAGWLTVGPLDLALAQSPAVVAECNQLAEVINQNQEILAAFEAEINTFAQNASQAETLEDIKGAAAQYVAAVDSVTDNLNGLVTELEILAIADRQITLYRDDYVAVVGGFNEALGLVSAAMNGVATTASEAELPTRLDALQTDTNTAVGQIEQLANAEADIINNVNEYCGAAPE